jgi:hypothetical protein
MSRLIVSGGLGLMLLLAASQVPAQTRKDVSVGYGFMQLEGEPDFPFGLYVSFAEGGIVKGVADVSYYQTNGEWLFASQGGVRFGPQTRRVRPFGQALFGFAFHRVGGFGGAFWTAQLGGGVDISTRAAGPALRLGLDMPVFFSNGGLKIVRGTVGIVFKR